MYELLLPPEMVDPVLVIGLAGWGDAASSASDAVDTLVDSGSVVANYDPDRVFDYRSNRPVLRANVGEPMSLMWPRLQLVHAAIGHRHMLALVGNEPDYAWHAIAESLVELAETFDVSHVVSVGSVPAPVRHAMPSPCLAAASDSRLIQPGDDLMMDSIVVPASATTVFRASFEAAGFPTIGYWAQVPQYVGRPYHAAVHELLRKIIGQLGNPDYPLEEIEQMALDQIHRLDDVLAKRSDAQELVEGLDISVGSSSSVPQHLPTADEIADEVARFLQATEDPDD